MDTNHEQKVLKILEDLYTIDASFKSHEPELKKLISGLLLSKPDTKFDPAFAHKLRVQLLTKSLHSYKSPYASFFSSRLFFTGIGVVAAIVIILPFTLGNMSPGMLLRNNSTSLSVRQEIEERGDNAFGTLAYNTNAQTTGGMGGGLGSDAARSYMAPTAPAPSATTMSVAEGQATSEGAVGKMIAPYYPHVTKYEYKGDPITLTATEGEVYKRIKGQANSQNLLQALYGSTLGLFNFSSFSGLSVKNVDVSQDNPNGYTININFEEGAIAMSPSWHYWSTVSSAEYRPLSRSEIPTDEVLIAKANDFLKDHGINTTSYGQPIVQSNSYMIMAGTDARESSYVAEDVSVIYPLRLSGKEIFDEGGYQYGLQVQINIRQNKITGVFNLTTQSYESSTYALETDPQKIIDAATFTPDYDYPANVRIAARVVTLTTPREILMRYFMYNNNGGQPQELYVPALMFPIVNPEPGSYPQGGIIVPLVKDILANRNQPMPGKPMPLIEPQPASVPPSPAVDMSAPNQ